MTIPLTIDDRTIRARKFASQIMAIIGDCVSDKDGAASRLIDAAYQADAQITRISDTDLAVAAERERCALIAVSFGEFPGGRLVKELRIMCGSAIADKIREPLPADVSGVTERNDG